MNLLIKKVFIADKKAQYFGLRKDILIEDNQIVAIDDSITSVDTIVIEDDILYISQGWVDVFSDFADPGYEHRESIESGVKAAVAGGFTHVFVVPNTKPIIQNKPQVAYILQKAERLPIHVYPIGAVSKNIEGKDLAEMYEMQQEGAIAFSDGWNPLQSAGLMVKALQYIKAFDGTIIQIPNDKSIGAFGLMTEGIISTQLGLPGSPALAEILLIKRDIDLVKYTNSKLHFTGISTAESVELITKAKAEGLNITCSVTPYHLSFCDEDLVTYDTNLKVNPPLRTREDMMALRSAVKEGHIDCITSHHLPQNWDNKTCEFEYASNGMIGLQSSFSVINNLFPDMPTENLIDLLGNNVRTIFNLTSNTIEVGSKADFTLFSRTETSTYTIDNNKSHSLNSAFFDKELKGKVKGIFSKGQWLENQL